MGTLYEVPRTTCGIFDASAALDLSPTIFVCMPPPSDGC